VSSPPTSPSWAWCRRCGRTPAPRRCRSPSGPAASAGTPPETEAAVYFSCLEALQNVVKHAGATAVLVRLEEDRSGLRFSVADDGAGFDLHRTRRGAGLDNMTERVRAAGGELTVRSIPGRGTTVTGRMPARRPEPVG
jgi:signal transduction histidine kinase